MIQRRTFLKAASVAGITSVSGCLNRSGGSDTDSIKIGAVLPLSGSFARTGEENERGLEVAKSYLNDEILGREFELIVEDGESSPSASIQAARTLIYDNDVDAIIGPASSGTSITLMEFIKEDGQVPLLPTTASSIDARENPENCNSYSFFIWPSNRHLVPTGTKFIQALPNHINRDINPSRVHFVSLDYALGQSNLELVKEEMNKIGGEVTGSTLVPLSATDWSSYISEISNSEADVVTGVLTWGAVAQLVPQANSFGLPQDKVMMFNSGKPVGQFAASTIPDQISVNGWFGTHFYNPGLNTELNNNFKRIYNETNSNLLPNSTAGASFEIMRALATAIENGGSTDADDIISELEGLKWKSIFGPIQFREEDHQCALNFVGARRVDSNRSTPDFETLEQYPNVIPEPRCSL